MVDTKSQPRESGTRLRLLGGEIFKGFKVAFGIHQIGLAIVGILVLALGWWVLAAIFYGSSTRPDWNPNEYPGDNGWHEFKSDRRHWNIRHEAAGDDPNLVNDEAEVCDTLEEYDRVHFLLSNNLASLLTEVEREKNNTAVDVETREKNVAAAQKRVDDYRAWSADPNVAARVAAVQKKEKKPYGELRTWPWLEDRGPNPFLVVNGQADPNETWNKGYFFEWLLTEQLPVLMEPLFKLFRPVGFLLRSDIGTVNAIYFLLVILWTLLTWSFFGGAISRIAAVKMARQDSIYSSDAIRYVRRHLLAYLGAPMVPLVLLGFCFLFTMLFGLFHMIPWLGELVVDGIFFFLMILVGLAMAALLVGMIGWPLMVASVSVEGADIWDAFTRCYQYVYQSIWRYVWYHLIALLYGAVVVFLFGLMASLALYLAQWGMSQTPGIEYYNREPAFLFVYSPTSYGWRDMLLQDARVDGKPVVDQTTGKVDPDQYNKYMGRDPKYGEKKDTVTTSNAIGAGMVSFWLTLMFLVVLGFSYSFFWSTSTIIFMLLRRDLDDHDMEEVHMDDEDEITYGGPAVPPPPVVPRPATPSLPMVPATPPQDPKV